MHLDPGHGVDRWQSAIVRRQHRDVDACFLFCVGKVKEKGRDVVPRITRERRGQMKHAHARSLTVDGLIVRARVGSRAMHSLRHRPPQSSATARV